MHTWKQVYAAPSNDSLVHLLLENLYSWTFQYRVVQRLMRGLKYNIFEGGADNLSKNKMLNNALMLINRLI